jgi:hypothetical protein
VHHNEFEAVTDQHLKDGRQHVGWNRKQALQYAGVQIERACMDDVSFRRGVGIEVRVRKERSARRHGP